MWAKTLDFKIHNLMESNICWSVQRRKLASSLKELLELCETLGLGLWSYDFFWHIHSSQFLDVGQGDEIDYRGVLHRDGSVLMSVSLDQLKVMAYNIVQLLTYAHKSVTLLTTQIKLLHTQAHMSYSLHFGQSRVVVECLVIDDSECACIHESTLWFSQVVPLIVFSHDSRHQKLYTEHWQPSLLLACLTR